MIKSNFAQFKKELDKEIEAQQKKQQDTFREIVFTMFNSIVTESPAALGYFRINNQISKDIPKTDTVGDDLREAGINIDTAEVKQSLISKGSSFVANTKIKNRTSIYITNNLDYADRLENHNHSPQNSHMYAKAEEQGRYLYNLEKRKVVK